MRISKIGLNIIKIFMMIITKVSIAKFGKLIKQQMSQFATHFKNSFLLKLAFTKKIDALK